MYIAKRILVDDATKGLNPAVRFCVEDLEQLRRQNFALLGKIKLSEPLLRRVFYFSQRL